MEENFEPDENFNVDFKVDLNNFPDPHHFMNLQYYNINTKEEFKQWWLNKYNQQIIKFQSFN